LVGLTRARMAELTEKAERAKRIVKTQEFYEADKLEWAINTFREVTDTISLAYAPARICMPPMETDLSYKVFVSSEVLDAIEDTQVNVYRDVFEHILKPAIVTERPDVIGISIVLQQQIFSTMTFCKLIKEQFPNIHVTIGGNTVTRLRDVLPKTPNLFALFDSAVIYEGYTAGYRTKKIDQIIEEIRGLKAKYRTRYFHFTDESYPPALFRKLTRRLVETNMDIVWTTHMRFEKSLSDEAVWQDARTSGCKFLHYGYESGSERVLKLMDKATTTEAIQRSLKLAADVGIWNHVMGFFGFPGETREDAYASMRFLEENKDLVHSIGFGTFDLSKHTPVAKNPEKFGVTPYINPEWDL